MKSTFSSLQVELSNGDILSFLKDDIHLCSFENLHTSIFYQDHDFLETTTFDVGEIQFYPECNTYSRYQFRRTEFLPFTRLYKNNDISRLVLVLNEHTGEKKIFFPPGRGNVRFLEGDILQIAFRNRDAT